MAPCGIVREAGSIRTASEGVNLTRLRSLAGSWLAERCPACAGASTAGFCPGCAAELPRIERPCVVCGLPKPVQRCPRSMGQWHVASVVAPFRYAPPLDGYLQALKFGSGRVFGRALALLVAEALAQAGERPQAGAVIVPMPLHRQRLIARGYNQAAEIARELASRLGAPMLAAAASRCGQRVPQSRLGARARQRNVAHAFRVGRRWEGRRIVIVDDVITTGATVNALALALLDAGAERVDAWAVARTVPAEGR
jgi:ComF family protein